MPKPTVSFMSTPLGSNVFATMFGHAEAKAFAGRMMTPAPSIIPTGPREANRHWDWKVSDGVDIVVPPETSIVTPYTLRPGDIVFDEYARIKEEDWDRISKIPDWKDSPWKTMYEGSFSTAEEVPSEPLTVEHIREAMEKVDMAGKRVRVPKKKKVSGDARRANYSARQFGNILLSMTKDIIGNTTLSDGIATGGDTVLTVQELMKPLFEEFFLVHGDKWQITGPMRLSAQSVVNGKWKSVSALGGEILEFQEMEIGTRDGVCISWGSGNIVGMDEEMIINTTIKKYGSQIVQEGLDGNPANRKTLVDLLLYHAGESDIVTASEDAKAKIVAAELKLKVEDLERKSAAYGEGFGSWG